MKVNTYKETRTFLTIDKINSFNYLLLQGEEQILGGKKPKHSFCAIKKKKKAWMFTNNLDINNYH